MNQSVLTFVGGVLPRHEVVGRRILEVGSLDVNGSSRQFMIPLGPSEYIGCDLVAGKGVDRIVNARFLVQAFGMNSFDIVISTEMIEHVPDWKACISQMKRVLKPGGSLVLTTRSPGFPFHEYPLDCWRFTQDDMRRIFSDMIVHNVESDVPQEPGVLVKVSKPKDFREADLGPMEVYRMPEYKA